MVGTHRHSNKRKSSERRKAGSRREEEQAIGREGTQWCSGITCVLAELRAHYPEHQHKEEDKKTRRQEDKKEEKTVN